jgi:pyridoxine kinase
LFGISKRKAQYDDRMEQEIEMTEKRVVTLQDVSCLGQCSLTVALPIISACGVEAAIIPSAVLSTHTGGFTGYTFHDLTDDIPKIMEHWKKEGQLFDCLYTGYLGSRTQIQYVGDLMEQILTDDGITIVDPVMADHGNFYAGFDYDFVRAMTGLCAKADIVLPNITEASFMAGIKYKEGPHEEAYILEILHRLAEHGMKKIILKGIEYSEKRIGVAIYDVEKETPEYYFTDRVPGIYHGTGDCYAAAFTGALMQGKSDYKAAAIAADFVVESIRQTYGDTGHWYGVRFERALPLLVNELNV